jgi:tetratricopeptide (TPR) repeat protein
MSACTSPKKKPGAVELPILQDHKRSLIRPSKVSRWRAFALLAVYALIAVHVAHYNATGETVSPLEPSEAMQFSTSSVVNAGLIFFGLTIASTLVLGRWFCGWACHVVALQDFCRWMLGKVGIHPRAVNLGILGVVPWLAFVYMFLATIVLRLHAGESLATSKVELYSSAFWRTFPSWPVAVLTFAVCGFAIVYVLGSKAFCSYGCPYGAIFGIADQLAPVRIRVTDACEGCGHCTAVCTSNVKVHQEVRDWKMVVDPACMKCLDCVSVCPKDALYVGVGAPALFAKRRTPKKAAIGSRAVEIARHALLFVFMLASFLVFTSYNGEYSAYVNPPEWRLSLELAAGSFLVALVFRGKAEKRREYSLGEDALLAAAFLAAMLALRGSRGYVPLLFGFGLAVMFAFALVHLVRVFRRRDLSVQRIVLKANGALRGMGVVYVLAMIAALVGLGFAFNDQLTLRRAARAPFAHDVFVSGLMEVQHGRFDRAEKTLRRALKVDPDSFEARVNLARVLCQMERYAEGARECELALEKRSDDVDTQKLAGWAWFMAKDYSRSLARLLSAARLTPDDAELHAITAEVYDRLGEPVKAAAERALAAPRPR